jgi:hypothetical protein
MNDCQHRVAEHGWIAATEPSGWIDISHRDAGVTITAAVGNDGRVWVWVNGELAAASG